jgi:hypothetical protein
MYNYISSPQKLLHLPVSHLAAGDVILESLLPLQKHFPYPGALVKMPQQCSQAMKITVNQTH